MVETIKSYVLEKDAVPVGVINCKILFHFVDRDDNVLDISTATVLSCKIRKPDDTVVTQTPLTFESNGVDGQAYYLTQAGDIDQIDQYELWGYVKFTGSLEAYSLPVRIRAIEVPADT